MKIELKSDYRTRDPARGFSLAEALLRYGGLREAWRIEVLAMLRAANPSPLLDLSIEGENRVIEKLLSGEFHATGFEPNSPLGVPPAHIHPWRWRALKPRWENSTAHDANGPVTGIVVYPFPAGAVTRTTPIETPRAVVVAPGPKPGQKDAAGTMWQIAETILTRLEWRDRRRGWRTALAGEIKDRLPAGMDYDRDSIRKMLKLDLDNWEKKIAG